MFTASLFTIVKIGKQPKSLLTQEWVKKMYTMEYYAATKKTEIMPSTVMWMELEIIILTEISQRKTNK